MFATTIVHASGINSIYPQSQRGVELVCFLAQSFCWLGELTPFDQSFLYADPLRILQIRKRKLILDGRSELNVLKSLEIGITERYHYLKVLRTKSKTQFLRTE